VELVRQDFKIFQDFPGKNWRTQAALIKFALCFSCALFVGFIFCKLSPLKFAKLANSIPATSDVNPENPEILSYFPGNSIAGILCLWWQDLRGVW
jgi:hypothetical protein